MSFTSIIEKKLMTSVGDIVDMYNCTSGVWTGVENYVPLNGLNQFEDVVARECERQLRIRQGVKLMDFGGGLGTSAGKMTGLFNGSQLNAVVTNHDKRMTRDALLQEAARRQKKYPTLELWHRANIMEDNQLDGKPMASSPDELAKVAELAQNVEFRPGIDTRESFKGLPTGVTLLTETFGGLHYSKGKVMDRTTQTLMHEILVNGSLIVTRTGEAERLQQSASRFPRLGTFEVEEEFSESDFCTLRFHRSG